MGGMRKSTSRITRLPPEVREEINRKMDSGWAYRLIRKWLFEQVAECDVPALELVKGDSYSLAWLRAAKSPEHAWHHCELALGNWYRVHHPLWLKLQVQGSESMRLVKRAGMLTKEAAGYASADAQGYPPSRGRYGGRFGGQDGGQPSAAESAQIAIEGGNVMMRSVLIDAISTIRSGSTDPKDIAQLANAWARLNQGHVEAEKLQLKRQDSVELAFDELGKDVRNDPEAKELFYRFYAAVKRLEEKAEGRGPSPTNTDGQGRTRTKWTE
jgi:hypothetical protein